MHIKGAKIERNLDILGCFEVAEVMRAKENVSAYGIKILNLRF